MAARSRAAQCRRQAIKPGQIGWQAEPEQIAGVFETAAPDVPAREADVDVSGITMPRQAKQRRAVDDVEAAPDQHPVDRLCHLLQLTTRFFRPVLIAQGRGSDRERRAGARPGAERRSDVRGDRRSRDGEAQPHTGKAIEFTERAQDHERSISAQRDRARSRHCIDERFVDDQPSALALHGAGGLHQRGVIEDATVGIVGIDHHHMDGAGYRLLDRTDIDHLAPSGAPGDGVFAVGRTDHGNRTRRGQVRQPLDQRLGARRGDEIDSHGNVIGGARRRDQRLTIGAGRQALPDIRSEDGRNGPRARIDAGRQIQPRRWPVAKLRDCLAEIATVFHVSFMPSSFGKREGVRDLFRTLAALAAISVLTVPVRAAELPRVASINLCTDQLLMTLADPAQILGLSPYARDAARSWAAAEAAHYPMLSGEAEDVLELKPDLVVAGRFTKRATRELLKAQGLKVVEFDAARSIEDTKTQIKRMGDVLGHPDRALAQIARIDAAVTRARETVARKPLRILAVSRRGWVSGGDSLTSSLLATIGIANAAQDLGYKLGGFASLETILTAKPDFLLVSEDSDFAEDQGRAFLLHPALEQLYPPSKRLVLSERLTVCGGPMLADALDRLVTEFTRVEH